MASAWGEQPTIKRCLATARNCGSCLCPQGRELLGVRLYICGWHFCCFLVDLLRQFWPAVSWLVSNVSFARGWIPSECSGPLQSAGIFLLLRFACMTFSNPVFVNNMMGPVYGLWGFVKWHLNFTVIAGDVEVWLKLWNFFFFFLKTGWWQSAVLCCSLGNGLSYQTRIAQPPNSYQSMEQSPTTPRYKSVQRFTDLRGIP